MAKFPNYVFEKESQKIEKAAQSDQDAWRWRDFRKALLSAKSRGPHVADRLEYLADTMNGVDQEVSDVLLALAGKANRERTGEGELTEPTKV